LLVSILLSFAAFGCSYDDSAVRAEIGALRGQIAEYNRKLNDVNVKMETLNTQVLLLEEKLQVSRKQQGAKVRNDVSRLRVVKLTPTNPEPQDEENVNRLSPEVFEKEKKPVRGKEKLPPVHRINNPQHKPPSKSKTTEDFKTAVSIFKQKRYTEAVREFTRFLKRHPDNKYSDDAVYYTGMAYLAENEYRLAMDEFRRAMEWPNSNRIADAMIGIGLCYKGIGDTQSSIRTFTSVKNKFPNTEAAKQAQHYLANMAGRK